MAEKGKRLNPIFIYSDSVQILLSQSKLYTMTAMHGYKQFLHLEHGEAALLILTMDIKKAMYLHRFCKNSCEDGIQYMLK